MTTINWNSWATINECPCLWYDSIMTHLLALCGQPVTVTRCSSPMPSGWFRGHCYNVFKSHAQWEIQRFWGHCYEMFKSHAQWVIQRSLLQGVQVSCPVGDSEILRSLLRDVQVPSPVGDSEVTVTKCSSLIPSGRFNADVSMSELSTYMHSETCDERPPHRTIESGLIW